MNEQNVDEVKILTNNVGRPVLDASQLTEKERAMFDYLNWPAIERGEDSASFVRYRGELYDLGEFMTTWGMPDPFRKWDGYQADTFFSGVLVHYVSSDPDYVVMGRWYS